MCGLGNSSSKEREFERRLWHTIFINVNVGEGAKIIFCLARAITARKIVFFSKGREVVRTNFLARVTVVQKFLNFEC